MDFESAFRLRFWINLGRREDRRVETEARLAEAGVVAERIAGVDGRTVNTTGNDHRISRIELGEEDAWPGGGKAKGRRPLMPLKDGEGRAGKEAGQDTRATSAGVVNGVEETRGYESPGRFALALTQRLVLREAARRRAPAVLLLEDDVVFHPNFKALVAAVELPDDWGIFYLGCAHAVRPEWAGTRVVRVRRAVDMHAVAIRASHYRRVMKMLDRHRKADAGVPKASDQYLALLHDEIPTYAAYPNLAWQDVSDSNLMHAKYSNYTSDGRQKNWVGAVTGLLDEAVGGNSQLTIDSPDEKGRDEPGASEPRKRGWSVHHQGAKEVNKTVGRGSLPTLGLLFLTRGDVNHPAVWREFVAEAPGRTRVFSHAKFPSRLRGGFLDRTGIPERFETEWGGISLVRASRAMLLEALDDASLTHFVLLSEACVPVRPLPEILRRLEIDPRPQFGFKTLKEAVARHAARVGAVPEIPAGCWRFTSQWWLMDRAAAVFAAGPDYTPLFEKMVVPDEAYFATVLAMQGYPLRARW